MLMSKEMNDTRAHQLGRLHRELAPIIERYGDKVVHNLLKLLGLYDQRDIEWMTSIIQDDINVGQECQLESKGVMNRKICADIETAMKKNSATYDALIPYAHMAASQATISRNDSERRSLLIEAIAKLILALPDAV